MSLVSNFSFLNRILFPLVNRSSLGYKTYRLRYILMSEQILNRTDIVDVFEQVGGE